MKRVSSAPAGADQASARTALRLAGIALSCECSVVQLSIDGARFAVVFSPDSLEHQRRKEAGVGAATDTGLLHALWTLPLGLPIPLGSLDPADATTLAKLGRGYIDRTGDTATRVFSPAGVVTTAVVVAQRLGDAVRRVAQQPPIFGRLAASWRHPGMGSAAVALATESGVGAVVLTKAGPGLLVAPRPAERGVPAVYRWWISELAYRNWTYTNCAHCRS